MKLKIKTNFSFNKLSNQLNNLIDGYTASYAKDSAEGSKQAINAGLTPDLEDSTVLIRKKRTQPTRPPLKASGKLYKSIKQKKNALEMLYYGDLHDKGFKTKSNSMIPNKTVPARPFIQTTLKNKQKIDKKFMQDINKALKK